MSAGYDIHPVTSRPAIPRVVCFATKGAGSSDEHRIIELLGDVEPEVYPFDRGSKIANVPRILRLAMRRRPDLLVMEGTGLAGGVALLLARVLCGVPFVVSSGDAVGPFLGARRAALALPGWLYEALLYRLGAGFIGWTPYLAGRAFTMGCPRVMTAAHFAADPEIRMSRAEVRRRLGIPEGTMVAGIVGSLMWNDRYGYCYGWELVTAMRRVRRSDVAVVVVGSGDGVERLRALAGDDLGRRIFVPGPVEPELAVSYLAAMDIGSLPQSVDQAGGFRYTTKLPEYVAARLPVVTGQIPAAYDLMADWSWRLPGDAPWDERYLDALAILLEDVRPLDVAQRRSAIPGELSLFSAPEQRRRAGAFVRDVVDRRARHSYRRPAPDATAA
jgi:hypothetical protein